MGIGVSIVFYGAVRARYGRTAPARTGVLVDAKGVGEVGGIELPAHAPTLVVASAASSTPKRAARRASSRRGRRALRRPRRGRAGRQIGLWDLTGCRSQYSRPRGW